MLSSPELQKNPYLYFGFGIFMYFKIYGVLIFFFAIMTMLSLPSFYIFSKFNNYEGDIVGKVAAYSLGSLGYSTTKCVSVSLGVGDIALACRTGTMQKLDAFGYVPSDEDSKDFCMPHGDTHCDAHMNKTLVQDHFDTYCKGNTRCNLLGIDGFYE